MVDIISDQRRNTEGGGCMVYISWTLPSNVHLNDLAHFMIFFNGTPNNRIAVTSTNLTVNSILHPVCICGAHNISITAINRCGIIGEIRHHVVKDPEPLPDVVCVAVAANTNLLNNTATDCGNQGKHA